MWTWWCVKVEGLNVLEMGGEKNCKGRERNSRRVRRRAAHVTLQLLKHRNTVWVSHVHLHKHTSGASPEEISGHKLSSWASVRINRLSFKMTDFTWIWMEEANRIHICNWNSNKFIYLQYSLNTIFNKMNYSRLSMYCTYTLSL